jgi:hypothetical protein
LPNALWCMKNRVDTSIEKVLGTNVKGDFCRHLGS